MKKNWTLHIIHWMLGLALGCYSLSLSAHQPIATYGMEYPSALGMDNSNNVPMLALLYDDEDTPEVINDSIVQANAMQLEALEAPADTAALAATQADVTKKNGKVKLPKKQFVPDPQRALWLSLVFPGAGQIYNRKYWKLPIIYGGFLGCTYALLWNQQMYMDYSQAYLDIMDDDPNTDSYKDMLPPRYDITGQEERFKKIFKNKKDRFRRYRDLSTFCFIGVYLISVVDAYVDAQLSEFDITPDLTLRVEPAVISQKGIKTEKNAYGIGCSINF